MFLEENKETLTLKDHLWCTFRVEKPLLMTVLNIQDIVVLLIRNDVLTL